MHSNNFALTTFICCRIIRLKHDKGVAIGIHAKIYASFSLLGQGKTRIPNRKPSLRFRRIGTSCTITLIFLFPKRNDTNCIIIIFISKHNVRDTLPHGKIKVIIIIQVNNSRFLFFKSLCQINSFY